MIIKKIIIFFTLLTYFFLINYSKVLSAETLSRNKLESFYVPEKGYAVLRDSNMQYVKPASQTWLIEKNKVSDTLDWLLIGFEQRTRFEYRENDLKVNRYMVDTPVLSRTKLYFGIKELLDPFRFAVEIQDSRAVLSKFNSVNQSDFFRRNGDKGEQWNQFEPISAYLELFFKEIWQNKTLAFQAGRMHFEYLDRRLISDTPWRNTQNVFQGGRVQLGTQYDEWSVDFFAVQPLRREIDKIDVPEDASWLYAAFANYRGISYLITLQPFYILQDQPERTSGQTQKNLHTYGLRGYGIMGETGFDYDFSTMIQNGTSAFEKTFAYAVWVETGYSPHTFIWQPRISLFYAFISGDRALNDGHNTRFDRLYGAGRPWEFNRFIQAENIETPRLMVELKPLENVNFETGLQGYWLASSTDRWNQAGLRDSTGNSGRFLGWELNFRLRFPILELVKMNLGYAYFEPGRFVESTARERKRDVHFFYTELTVTAF